ncbi:rho guanine nucleotide exchange factor 10-like [Diadema antillarum]|uniref:rho guanine nucleotide exchange factor 10-like n=1 Tax=Diadema antillarum TaxID=105358 RepID=UPI003A85A0BD
MSDAMDNTHADEDKPVILDSPSDSNTTTTPSSDQSREVTYEILLPNENEAENEEQYSMIPELDQSNYTELIQSELPEPSTYETTTFHHDSSPVREHGWQSTWPERNENEDIDEYSQSAVSMADVASVNSQSASSAADAQSIHSNHSAQSMQSETSPDRPEGDDLGSSRVTSLIDKLNQSDMLGSRPVPTSLPLGTTRGTMGPYASSYAKNPGQALVGSPSQIAGRATIPRASFKTRAREPILGSSVGGELQMDEDGNEFTEWTENEIYQATNRSDEYTASPLHLAHRFDALEVDMLEGGIYEDVQFDESEQGFFIDDDLLYEDILGPPEEEMPLDDYYESDDCSDCSWGSEEWDTYDSEQEEMVHSYVEPTGEHSPKGVVERGGAGLGGGGGNNVGSSHRRAVVSAYGMEKAPQREEAKQSYLEWMKDLKNKGSLGKVRTFLFGRQGSERHHEDREDPDEDKDDIHYIDVKLSHMKHPPPTLPPQPEGLSIEQIGRRHVVQAIVDSERNYMMSLQRLVQAYEKPLLESEPPLLEKEKVKTIFYRVRGIYQCHLMFQIALASRIKEWDNIEQIGDVFVASFSKAMVLEVYSAYVNNFTHAMETAKKAASQKPAFREFVESRQLSSSDRLSLYGLMLKPVQRFPQFICLLQDLLKRTHQGHADRMPLQLALTKLETLASVLNERKKQSEQRHAVKQLIKNLNVKFSSKMSSERNRWLIRQDDMLQTVKLRPRGHRSMTYDGQGEELKCKERRLFMLNDLLVCTTVLNNNGQPSPPGTMDMPRFKHRWSVPLTEVEVVNPTIEGTDIEMSTEPGKLKITTQHMDEHEYLYGGSTRQLYQERNDLLHDLAVVKQLGALLGTLKGTYGVLTKDDIDEWSEIINKLITKKGQEIKQADVSKIQLSLPSVHLDQRVTLVFDAVSGKIKLDWITALETAKLGMKPHNNPGWYAPDEGDTTHAEMNFGVPLIMKALPVFPTRQQTKFQCSVLCPLEQPGHRSRRKGILQNEGARNCLWVCSSDQKSCHVSLVGFLPPSPQVLETFEATEGRVLCMECVPGWSRQGPGTNFLNLKESERKGDYCFTRHTVWMGTESGRVLIYRINQSDKSTPLATFKALHPITAIQYLNNRVFISLDNGSVLIYFRSPEGEWKVKEPRVSLLGEGAVTCLLAVRNDMWCGCENKVHIIDTESEFKQISFEAHDPSIVVRQMVVAGVGVWVSFTACDSIRLFHTETMELLQDISVGSPIGRMVASLTPRAQASLHVTSPVHVTTLLACYGSLWVGTNTGILVNFPLPRLEGVPLVNGPAMVSYHTHKGPVRMLIAMELNRTNDRVLFSSREDDEESEASRSLSDLSTPSSRLKSGSQTADLVNNAMSPMTDYLNLTFNNDRNNQSAASAASATSGGHAPTGAVSSGNGNEPRNEVDGMAEGGRPARLGSASEMEVSANVTSTTSLVISGGEGHDYLMQVGENVPREAKLLMWQVSN